MIVEGIFTPTEQRRLLLIIAVNWVLLGICKATKACPEKEKTLCYSITCLFAVTPIVVIGCGAVADGSYSELSITSVTRIHGFHHSGFQELAQWTCAYEVWNALTACIIPHYRTKEFLGHHIVTALLAKLSQQYGPAFYGIFFFGLASISTLPLALVDIFRYGPKELAEQWPTINTICRVSFAILFLLIRGVIWPIMSFIFWWDAIQNMIHGEDDNSPPSWWLGILLISNTFLGTLQMIWGVKIWKGLSKVLFGSTPKKSND
jgi:hypothetical protein